MSRCSSVRTTQSSSDCHKGIACFNKCCQSIDIMLAPYDILRLKKRLGMCPAEFLARTPCRSRWTATACRV